MRTFHWIVQYFISKMGKDNLLLFNRIHRELEREGHRKRKFCTEYIFQYDGLIKRWENDLSGKKIVVVGSDGHITPKMLKALNESLEENRKKNTEPSIEPLNLEIKARPEMDVQKIYKAHGVPPKEFGIKKLGKQKKK